MDKKLTLSLDQNIIERAKMYAQMNNISVSKLIEAYLSSLTTKSEDISITPLVESLSGVIDLEDKQSDYTDYLMDKYK